jgi:hypothetical protein
VVRVQSYLPASSRVNDYIVKYDWLVAIIAPVTFSIIVIAIVIRTSRSAQRIEALLLVI